MDPKTPVEVVVIGAGIVGLACALRLQMDGRKVLLLDPNEPASGCSHGNAGYLADTHIFPPAALVPLPQLPKMLLDPLGPLVLRAAYLPTMLPWALRAAAALRPASLARTIKALAAINRLAIDSYAPFLEAAGARDLLDRKGALTLFQTPAGLDAAATRMPDVLAQGLRNERLDAQQVRALEPAVAAGIAGAIYHPDSARCLNPRRLGQRFAEALVANGATFHRAPAASLQPRDDGSWSIQTHDAREFLAKQVVVSAGARTDRLLRPLGYRVPLAAERGYHLMLPHPGVSLSRPVSAGEHFFAMTPMEHGLRLAGTAEYADVEAPMDPRRSDLLLGLAQRYLPGLAGDGATRWMGARPSLPDGLPAIGHAQRHPNLFYCFGHQHLGLTQAAISASIIGHLVTGSTPPVDAAPYSLARFERAP